MQVSGERARANRHVKIQTRVVLKGFRCRYHRRCREWYHRKEHRVGPHDRVAGKVLVVGAVGVGALRRALIVRVLFGHEVACHSRVLGGAHGDQGHVEECRQCMW